MDDNIKNNMFHRSDMLAFVDGGLEAETNSDLDRQHNKGTSSKLTSMLVNSFGWFRDQANKVLSWDDQTSAAPPNADSRQDSPLVSPETNSDHVSPLPFFIQF